MNSDTPPLRAVSQARTFLPGGCRLGGLTLALLALLACPSAPDREIRVQFEARMGANKARCGETYAREPLPITLGDMRFYVSALGLLRRDGTQVPLKLATGTPWQFENVALLDFENRQGRCAETGTLETNSVVVGTVPAGDYVGLFFDLGVPDQLNHLDATMAPSPLNLNVLYWSWQFGYIFAKVDYITPDAPLPPDDAPPPAPGELRPNRAFLAHIGSTGCQSPARTQAPTQPCLQPNRLHLVFPSFDPARHSIQLDLEALAAGIDLSRSVPRPPGCMSGAEDPDCSALFENFGLDLATGKNRQDPPAWIRVAPMPPVV